MKHYNHTQKLQSLWDHAISVYQSGNRASSTFFDSSQLEVLASMGLKPMDVYDPVEDFLVGAEPDFPTFLTVCEVRRDYFLNILQGSPPTTVLDPDTLPSKTDSVAGIEWLPRIIPKAKAKLRGELPDSIMYGCGGDRRFFRAWDIHPAEFLRLVWAYWDDESAIVAWVKQRKAN